MGVPRRGRWWLIKVCAALASLPRATSRCSNVERRRPGGRVLYARKGVRAAAAAARARGAGKAPPPPPLLPIPGCRQSLNGGGGSNADDDATASLPAAAYVDASGAPAFRASPPARSYDVCACVRLYTCNARKERVLRRSFDVFSQISDLRYVHYDSFFFFFYLVCINTIIVVSIPHKTYITDNNNNTFNVTIM